MRKLTFIFLALSLVLSCTREGLGDDGGKVIGDGVPLTAVAADPLQTKAAIDDGTGVFTWTAGDQLAVFAGHPKYGERYYTAYLPDSEAGQTSCTFKIDYYGDRKNFAVYPATHALSSHPEASDLRITIPGNYKTSLAAPALYPPMIAQNQEGQDLTFKHVCGLLRLTLNQVPVDTRRIKVWLGENTVGIYQVDTSDPDHPFVSIDNPVAAGSSQDVTFTLNAAVTSSTRDGYVLNVPLPEGTYYNLGLTFYKNLTTNKRNQYRIYRGEKRVIKAGHGYHETIDCSGAVVKNLWSISMPATSVAWGSSTTVTPTFQITNGSYDKDDLSGENGIALDMDLVCYTEDPSVATAYVQPITSSTDSARPQVVIKGINPGETYIRLRARYGDNYMWSDRIKITVYSNNSSYMPALSYPRYMVVGNRFQLGASLSGNFEFRTYAWEQVDGFDYATLSSEGLLTATAKGTVHLACTATTNEGSVERYPVTVRIIDHPAGTLKGVFTSSINGDISFFSTGNLIYYKESQGDGVYEAYDNTYDPDNMNGHFEFMSPQYEFYTGRYNTSYLSKTYVEAFDMFNYRLPMLYFCDSGSTRPVEVEGNETTGWHAPTRDQWNWILFSRPCSTVGGTANARYAKAVISHLPIADIPGLIIFPDCYIQPENVPYPQGINTASYAFADNKFSPAEWELMEQEGAVFLPNRDRRNETDTMWPGYGTGNAGLYWDNIAEKNAYPVSYLVFKNDNVYWEGTTSGSRLGWVQNLRLIKDLE